MKTLIHKTALALLLAFALTACRNSSDHSSTNAGTSTHGTAEGMESGDAPQSPGTNRSETGTATDASNTPGGGTMTDSSAAATPQKTTNP